MPGTVEPIDGVFRALSDRTRRQVLARLSQGAASVTDLAEPFSMALPSFMQHLHVLEQCGLVRSDKHGRVRTYRLVPERMKLAEEWLAQQRSLWELRLDQLDDYLSEINSETKETRP